MAGNEDFLGPAVDDEHIIKLSDVYAKKTDVDDTYAKKTDVDSTYAKKTDVLNILKQLITLDVTYEFVSDDDHSEVWYIGHVDVNIKSNVVGLYYEIISTNRGVTMSGHTTSTDQAISSPPRTRFYDGYEIRIRLPDSTVDLYHVVR